MRARLSALFVCEGSSDAALADVVELLFLDRGVTLQTSRPDFTLLPQAGKDVESRLRAGLELMGRRVDLAIVHRDADNGPSSARRREIIAGHETAGAADRVLPVVPVRMTEAWLLLDEPAIRHVAGNPHGRTRLHLPKPPAAERVADPKRQLRETLLGAAEVTGRRRDRLDRRFNENRRQLLERLDRFGPVTELPSWKALVTDIDAIVAER